MEEGTEETEGAIEEEEEEGSGGCVKLEKAGGNIFLNLSITIY